jgi:hypothetical protein
MRGGGLILAAALTALSASSAKAEEWCGYATGNNAVIECGFTTAAGCENSFGKRGLCFVDPDLALGSKLTTPLPRHSAAAHSVRARTDSRAQVFIESKNSELFLVLRSLSSRKSIASMVPMGLRMRRSTYIFLS